MSKININPFASNFCHNSILAQYYEVYRKKKCTTSSPWKGSAAVSIVITMPCISVCLSIIKKIHGTFYVILKYYA